MSVPSQRQRSTTTSSNAPPITESTTALKKSLSTVSQLLESPTTSRSTDISRLHKQIQIVRRDLSNCPETARPKDVFRHEHGFSILLNTLRAASGYYQPSKRTVTEKEELFDLLKEIVGLLSDLFRNHHGNRKYFKKRVEGGGWDALEQAIACIGFGGSDSDIWGESHLFGLLLAFAVDDLDVISTFNRLTSSSSRQIRGHSSKKSSIDLQSASKKPDSPQHRKYSGNHSESPTQDRSSSKGGVAQEAETFQITSKKTIFFVNVEIVPVLISFWKLSPRDKSPAGSSASLLLMQALLQISSASNSNLISLHSTGILSSVLPFAFEENNSLAIEERMVVERLCSSLFKLGITNLDDARYLLSNKSAQAAEFLLEATKASQMPPHIHFDLSLNGFASLELQSLGRSFPPPPSTPGYTFTAWIYVEKFDAHEHTTIFGAFDPSQTCFVLAYLERDTHNFILQTSVTSNRPSVRFRSTTFMEKKWYHIAIVHRRPRTLSSSKATLHVDGEFMEQVKCNYPATPPAAHSSTDSFASFASSTSKLNPVQAFLGTPRDLSTRLGQGAVLTRWSLASAHLFEDTLSDDLVAVHFRLGPRYSGNFQDCLGSFQTYEASAALGMRNETMHPGKDEKSEILAVIQEKAGLLVPEARIIMSILPCAVLEDETRCETRNTQLLRGLSKVASAGFAQLTRNSSGSIAINAAVPSINDALIRYNGTAVLTGDPVAIVPQSLDDAMWRLGGCTAIGLKLVEEASSAEEVIRAIEIVFESVKLSWRNSEAMERENGYSILGALIRGKIGVGTVIQSRSDYNGISTLQASEAREKLSFQILSLILGFVGYDHAHPENSIINNPLAYRILLVDFDMWRKTSLITQKLYYKQFSTFGSRSKYSSFNARRLLRMRIVKRFLDALRGETFQPDVFPFFLEAFTALVKLNLNAETFRSLALFVTYALHKTSISASRTPKTRHGTLPIRNINSPEVSRKPTLSPAFDMKMGTNASLVKRQLGVGVLQVYTELLCEKGSVGNLKKFAKTVTNKWLLHLLTEDDPEVVVLGSKILARLLVVHGSNYVSKFSAEKTGGFVIMRHRLKRWWDIPTLWPICFSILFDRDVADIDFERSLDLFSLLDIFGSCKVVHPGVLSVITSMLQQGLNTLLRTQDDVNSPLGDRANGKSETSSLKVSRSPKTRSRSMSLTKELENRQASLPAKERIGGQAIVLHAVIRFLADFHTKSHAFRDFTVTSEYVRFLLNVLYPAIVSSDAVNPETELNSRDSVLTFEGDDVIIRPVSRTSTTPNPIVRTTSNQTISVETHLLTVDDGPQKRKAKPLRRGSSYILLTARPSIFHPSSAKLNGSISPKREIAAQQASNTIVEGILELIIMVFIDQILSRKEFPGFGLFLKVPPGFQEHQAYFESYILRNTISQLSNTVQLDQRLLLEPRVIMNMSRFCGYMCEAVYEGWFLAGAEPLVDFAGTLLEYLQRRDIAQIKSVRLCSDAVTSIRRVFLRIALLRLSEIDDMAVVEEEALNFLNRLLFWQTVIFSVEIKEAEFLRLICYQLYTKLVDSRIKIRIAATDLWRILLVHKPEDTSQILAMSAEKDELITGFKKLTELDNEAFLQWVDEHRHDLDGLFFGSMPSIWEQFVQSENARTESSSKSRAAKRREKLKQWHTDHLQDEDILLRHDVASSLWMKNIYASEHLKYHRAIQDYQDNLTFLASSYSKMDRDLRRPSAVFDDDSTFKWKLDRTEGRNRMRLRLLQDRSTSMHNYQPKRKITDLNAVDSLRLDTKFGPISASNGPNTPLTAGPVSGLNGEGSRFGPSVLSIHQLDKDADDPDDLAEDEFEFVDGPNDQTDLDEGYEDKNRKVMRSLQRGDQVQNVFNISRIIGLEACEGLLIIGKDSLYLIDNVFQRSDGEIVHSNNAPVDERDPYLQMISGQKATEKSVQPRGEQESRSWKWNDVLSISKRRFLFRDVAVEVFFTDGRSYLLTAISLTIRDDLYGKLASKAPHTSGAAAPTPEDAWRLEALRVPDETPATFGSKFGSIFNSSAWNPAMRRWSKGEISNFHYLMLVNTMAGRTFNDLTQYPVFPWVLADYTSEELDLNNPSTFRDLSKPMGAQHPSREYEFIDRYQSFAEMGDQPPFHYGTHYSSAMIVTSYLIRLQPFVQSYLLLQGGNFDHPDRLFYSIQKAWDSASKTNMTDVRELIPEFFYLPEFLTNGNGYNFGVRQGAGGTIDDVKLPPWAKGDPKIFIAKHREALESPHVSRKLHLWIDLVFGSKQRGEAAIENTNVFHHLSYHGAKDLDKIEDQQERLATIGIIHNFGQTPHQVFSRPHQPREEQNHRPRTLDTSVESLMRLPFPLLENYDRVATLVYSNKLDRIMCSTPFRLNMPPNYDRYLEWGFADNSIRFSTMDNKKLMSIFENLHQGQISTAVFADSRILVTGGVDCIVSVWSVTSTNSKTVDLQPKISLFGHKRPISIIKISKSFSTILSVSMDGQVLLWDLNRLEFVRRLSFAGRSIECAQINDVTGDIILCRGQKVALYTLNGELILDQNVCSDHDDAVFSCAFYEGTGNEWLENNLIFTGHRNGVVNIWNKCEKSGKWALVLVKRLDHVEQHSESGTNTDAVISCITPMSQIVYTGDDAGRVYEWDCVQRER